jgi:hypothetical protein
MGTGRNGTSKRKEKGPALAAKEKKEKEEVT